MGGTAIQAWELKAPHCGGEVIQLSQVVTSMEDLPEIAAEREEQMQSSDRDSSRPRRNRVTPGHRHTTSTYRQPRSRDPSLTGRAAYDHESLAPRRP